MDRYEKSKLETKRYQKIKELVKIVYGFDEFRPRQYEVINRIIRGIDTCLIMKTGGGKSFLYQVPAIYLGKPAVIVTPLVSLMEDQKLGLDSLGITSCCYNSNVVDKDLMLDEIIEGKYQFVYITPESIVNLKFFLMNMHEKIGISLVAVDEAHCISSFGFAFRKAYREINFLKDLLPNVPILAVTATATSEVAEDICKVLKFKKVDPIITGFDRPNLFLEVKRKSKKMERDIVPLLKVHENEPVIIYCVTRNDTEKAAQILTTCGIECGIYHAGLDARTKSNTHKQFLSGKLNVVAATTAFGMGINKPNVRAVIHYGAPRNIEGYYQEIG